MRSKLPSITFFLEKYTELGLVFFTLATTKDLSVSLACGLIFQAIKFITRNNKKYSNLNNIFSSIMTLCLLFCYTTDIQINIYLQASILSFSAVTQRNLSKKYSSSRKAQGKSYVRFVSILIAPLFYPSFAAILILAVAFFNFQENMYINEQQLDKSKYISPQKGILLCLHHVHYFVYFYALPYYATTVLKIPYWLLGILIYLGYIGYDEKFSFLLHQKNQKFILGHLIVSISLFILYYTENIWLNVVAWTASGFGASTIVIIERQYQYKKCFINLSMQVWENIGHVTGAGLAFILAEKFKVDILFLVAAIISLCTVVLAKFVVYDERE